MNSSPLRHYNPMTTLEKLNALVDNLWWSWNPDAINLFRSLNPEVFAATNNNPRIALQHADQGLVASSGFAKAVDRIYDSFASYMSDSNIDRSLPHVGYFCMEYGLHESIPIYSGGLGILAGDHTKAASDVGLPFTAVGLYLRDGYFKQFFDKTGSQLAEYPGIDSTTQPFRTAVDAEGNPIEVSINIGGETVYLQAKLMDIGRVSIVLLDADIDANGFDNKFLTRRLYGGDRKTRLQQEMILGIGGIRMLRALDISPDLFHMNEGHCAFLALELVREQTSEGLNLQDAENEVRNMCLFTTHTPVMAGHDRFDPGLFDEQMTGYASELNISMHDLLAYGRVNPDDHDEQFTMTVLGLNLAANANGVSKLNGEVARDQWKDKYPDRSVDEVPIGHVTNGIHLPTWTSPSARSFLDKHLPNWSTSRLAWNKVENIQASDLWQYRSQLRKRLVDFVNDRVQHQTLQQQSRLDPNTLTVGFARRFATYKRAPLLFHDLGRIKSIFANTDAPIQVIYAGKAHPADKLGQEFIREIFQFTQDPDFSGKLVFVEGYDMEIGRMLVSGCDVWLNNPRRPYEASGTSGQKVAVHGGLNLSILDGWWPEGFDGTNGWSIGTDASSEYRDPKVQDPEDANLLYEALETQVIPSFYQRDEDNVPQAWVDLMRSAMKILPYQFSARRMIMDYIDQYYSQRIPARKAS